MDENPYKSPEPERTLPVAGERRLVPAWRRIASLPLIIFGACYAFALPSSIIDAVGKDVYVSQRIVFCSLVSAAGAGMLWLGLRLRRRNR